MAQVVSAVLFLLQAEKTWKCKGPAFLDTHFIVVRIYVCVCTYRHIRKKKTYSEIIVFKCMELWSYVLND